VDLQPDDDQEQLRASVRAVLRQACPASLVRQVFEAKQADDAGAASRLWGQMVELDWPALSVPEKFGGLGLGFVELALVAEELGRFVAPGPFLPTVTQFAPMVRETAPDEVAEGFLRPLAEGRLTGALAVAEPAGRWEPAAVTATARRGRSGWILDGTKSWVVGACGVDEIAVVARSADGLGVFVVAGRDAALRSLPVTDPTLPLAEVTLDGVAVPPERTLVEPGDPLADESIARALDEATACMAVATNGTSRAIFDATLQYAKDRHQYGRPIGSFQALKHRLVDMYTLLERAAALGSFAAATIAEDDPRRRLAVSMAKAAAGDCQRLMVQDGLQLHGGIGFTWENDLHMFLKRAKTGDFLFGTARAHRANVARLLGVVP
jgi:alkylation response protein AidB-like acyl-CoA dehydrogenase